MKMGVRTVFPSQFGVSRNRNRCERGEYSTSSSFGKGLFYPLFYPSLTDRDWKTPGLETLPDLPGLVEVARKGFGVLGTEQLFKRLEFPFEAAERLEHDPAVGEKDRLPDRRGGCRNAGGIAKTGRGDLEGGV